MRPSIVIVEPHPDMAAAFEELLESAHFSPVVVPHLHTLADVGDAPAAIVVRVDLDAPEHSPHEGLEQLPAGRPPIVAIAWTDDEIAEANRLGCEVVLRAPEEVKRLCKALVEVTRDSA